MLGMAGVVNNSRGGEGQSAAEAGLDGLLRGRLQDERGRQIVWRAGWVGAEGKTDTLARTAPIPRPGRAGLRETTGLCVELWRG